MDENEEFDYEYEKFLQEKENMNKLFSIFIILVISAMLLLQLRSVAVLFLSGKNLLTESYTEHSNPHRVLETGVVYNFKQLSDATTDKDGNYAFNNLDDGMYGQCDLQRHNLRRKYRSSGKA
jgi:hypothetical protein